MPKPESVHENTKPVVKKSKFNAGHKKFKSYKPKPELTKKSLTKEEKAAFSDVIKEKRKEEAYVFFEQEYLPNITTYILENIPESGTMRTASDIVISWRTEVPATKKYIEQVVYQTILFIRLQVKKTNRKFARSLLGTMAGYLTPFVIKYQNAKYGTDRISVKQSLLKEFTAEYSSLKDSTPPQDSLNQFTRSGLVLKKNIKNSNERR